MKRLKRAIKNFIVGIVVDDFQSNGRTRQMLIDELKPNDNLSLLFRIAGEGQSYE